MRWSSCLRWFQRVWSNLALCGSCSRGAAIISMNTHHLLSVTPCCWGKVWKKKEDGGKKRRQGWCNKRRRTGHSGILTSLKRSWPAWQERLSLCVLSLCPEPLLAVTRASLRATCTEITRQFWCWSVFCAALCRGHLSNTPRHCGLTVWRQHPFIRLSNYSCSGLLMPLTQVVCLFSYFDIDLYKGPCDKHNLLVIRPLHVLKWLEHGIVLL